jgi:hypothetical protein
MYTWSLKLEVIDKAIYRVVEKLANKAIVKELKGNRRVK